MKDLYVSWDEYNRLIEKLAIRIHDSGWQFDAIVCLARGGLRVGDVLSRVFDRPLGVLFTSSYREAAGTKQSRLVEVVPALKERFPQVEEVRSAVIWRKGASVAEPDYYLEYLPTNPWIHQPFEEYDHMSAVDLKARWGA